MESFDARELAVIAASTKTIYWLFKVNDNNGVEHHWSTGDMAAWGASYWWEEAHTFNIINFSGINLRRSKSEHGIHAPSDVSFTIINPTNYYDPEAFIGAPVVVALIGEDSTGKEKIGTWRFRIKSASPYSHQVDIVAEDHIQYYLKGSYPNTRLLSDIFPNEYITENAGDKDNLCVPEPYGTCYIPLRHVYAVDIHAYLLGEYSESYTYSISEVRTPRSLGAKVTFDSGTYSFTQYRKDKTPAEGWQVFQPIIVDTDGDGTADDCGLWYANGKFLDLPTKFSRSDTASTTNPSDVIWQVLLNMGLSAADLDAASFATAKSTYASWGISWNFAFWYKQERTKVLSNLLAMCHSCLIVGETIKLQTLSKTSQGTITNSEVLTSNEKGQDSFRYTDNLLEKASDCGYVAYQESGESQDAFIKILARADGINATIIDSEVLEIAAIQDSQIVQDLGTLYFQRKFLKIATVSANLKSNCSAYRPDDVVTINEADYGGNYDILIDDITINADASVTIRGYKFYVDLYDFTDISSSAITVGTDTSTSAYQIVVSGPDADMNVLPGRVRIGSTSSNIVLDPSDPLMISLYDAGTEIMRFGNLKGFLDYDPEVDVMGFAIGDLLQNLKYSGGNLSITGVFTVQDGSGIGGWSINTTSIYTGTEDHSGYTQNAGDLTIYSDGSNASIHGYRFYIDSSGMIHATNVEISGALVTGSGSSISTGYLSGYIDQDNLEIANKDWSITCVFSATDADTVAWTDGVLTIGGDDYNIAAGNTGTIAGRMYIYFDSGITTALQTTYTSSSAVGHDKLLIATAVNGTGEASFEVFGGVGGMKLIATNALVANSITAGCLKVDEAIIEYGAQIAEAIIGNAHIIDLDVSKLNAGSITSKTITLAVTGGVLSCINSSGKTSFSDTDAGFILGVDTDGVAKFTIGDASNYMKWTGTGIEVYGKIVAGTGSDVDVPYLNIAAQGWTQTCAFSASDSDTVAWGAGTLTTAGGQSYSINAGNTGNMSARTFIYLDIATSTTAYQTTTTPGTAVGSGKILVATAVNGTGEASFETFGGVGGMNINAADCIVANSIVTACLAADCVTANEINVSNLASITATLGNVTAGTVTSASVMTKGSYLAQSTAGSDSTVYVGDTTDFPSSGTAWIFDGGANDRDSFTYTGKGSTTLTGCSGVASHTVSAASRPIVIPYIAGIYLGEFGELRLVGPLASGGAVQELASIGFRADGSDTVIGDFGAYTSANDRIAVRAQSYLDYAIYAKSNVNSINSYSESGSGVVGTSNGGYGVASGEIIGCGVVGINSAGGGPGVYADGGAYGPILLIPSDSADAPIHSAEKGTLWVTSAGVLYINTSGSTTWGKVGAQ